MRISIIDSGIGNIGSVKNMLKKIGYESIIHKDPPPNFNSNLIILPGVGTFDNGIKRLRELGWDKYLDQFRQNREKKILGICLGMQLLCDQSEEGVLKGLSFIPGKFVKFKFNDDTIKVPHMGWNFVDFKQNEFFNEKLIIEKSKFYFVHSYKYDHVNSDYIYGKTNYGGNYFPSIIGNKNIIGVQFHPEKSHKFGMNLFKVLLKAISSEK